MCDWMSAIVSRTGEVYRLDFSDAHEDIRAFYGLKDKADHLVPVEYSPDNPDGPDKPDTYKLRVHECAEPAWWSEVAVSVEAKLRAILERCIIRDKRAIIGGGPWILAEGSYVEKATDARIIAVCGGTLNAFCGGTLNAFRGGTLNAFWGGTLNDFWGGTLNDFWGGTLNDFCGGTLNAFWGGTIPDSLKARLAASRKGAGHDERFLGRQVGGPGAVGAGAPASGSRC